MKTYETMIILSANMEDEEQEGKIASFDETVKKAGGEILHVDKWGNRKLAYEIKKHTHGYSLILYYRMEEEKTKTLEREFRMDSQVLRYMTVVYEGKIPEEKQEVLQETLMKEEVTAEISPITKAGVSTDEEALEGERLLAKEILAEKQEAVEGDDIKEENSEMESLSEDEETLK